MDYSCKNKPTDCIFGSALNVFTSRIVEQSYTHVVIKSTRANFIHTHHVNVHVNSHYIFILRVMTSEWANFYKKRYRKFTQIEIWLPFIFTLLLLLHRTRTFKTRVQIQYKYTNALPNGRTSYNLPHFFNTHFFLYFLSCSSTPSILLTPVLI